MSDDENVVARRIDLYTMLLDAGAEVSICELANAAMYCGAEVVEVLLEHGVVPTSRTLSNILENYVDHDILRVILAAVLMTLILMLTLFIMRLVLKMMKFVSRYSIYF
ncbi:MAG: hypothetical protein HOI53_09710 [Francisellaceae bacterium]|nr:hypothetical protein [Francisellaceae bacterium]